ncbi:methylated-DNA--[protein]-cysteine S-methyltransferase [Nakamurella silvestris]|nr:methylated-DNA--[protein]-cysteine S-methyltransferase [Nakamurella silvestris]
MTTAELPTRTVAPDRTKALVATVRTPAGPFTVITRTDGEAVLASGWTDETGLLLPVIHPSLRPRMLQRSEITDRITDVVSAYHEGDIASINDVAVEQLSGPFLMHAWEVLRQVPPGGPVTYTEYAQLSGRPVAVRAAASACARNAAALFVPCHRVLRLDGSLGGFRWGLPVKQWLINHER